MDQGEKLQEVMTEMGWLYKDLAPRLGCSVRTIGLWMATGSVPRQVQLAVERLRDVDNKEFGPPIRWPKM